MQARLFAPQKEFAWKEEFTMIEAFDYMRQLNMPSIILRLSLAMLCGGMIGIDRAKKRRAAGFRTYMLVCLGAALGVVLSQYLHVMLTSVWSADPLLAKRTMDVSRIGEKVIGGVGFLGTGTIIITGKQEVKGLTTAAGLWASASLGIAIGAGCYECVIVAFALILLCFRLLPKLENYLVENGRYINIFVEFTSVENLAEIINCVKAQDLKIFDIDFDRGTESHSGYPSAVFSTYMNRKMPHTQLIAAISGLDSVRSVNEI